MYYRERKHFVTNDDDDQFWKNFKKDLGEIRQSINYMGELCKELSMRDQAMKCEALKSISNEEDCLLPKDVQHIPKIEDQPQAHEIRQSINYMGELCKELSLRDQAMKCETLKSIPNEEDCLLPKDVQPIPKIEDQPQAQKEGSNGEFLEVDEVILECNEKVMETTIITYCVMPKKSKTTHIIAKNQENNRGSDGFPTNILSQCLSNMFDDSSKSSEILFEFVHQQLRKRVVLKCTNYMKEEGFIQEFEIARNDDYKIALQGDHLDSRTNLFEERENDMNQNVNQHLSFKLLNGSDMNQKVLEMLEYFPYTCFVNVEDEVALNEASIN